MKQNTHWSTLADGTRPFSTNCAVLEVTGDGFSVGRCWYPVGNNSVCPRHGDVATIQKRYIDTGDLTREPREQRTWREIHENLARWNAAHNRTRVLKEVA